MKHIRVFNTLQEYESAYSNGLDLPNVSVISSTKKVFYHKRFNALVQEDIMTLSNNGEVQDKILTLKSGKV